MKKKTTRRKPKRKLPSRLARQICPSRPPRPEVNPQFRSFCLAYFASHDLRAFAGTIRNAALAGDRVFFDCLAKLLKNKLKRSPIGEQQSALLEVYFKKPYLSASEALKELGWPGDTRAISKSGERRPKQKAATR
jgi:hypothetical protein